MREFKVVVLGPGGVGKLNFGLKKPDISSFFLLEGKSALTVQFISGKFVERYDPTVEVLNKIEIFS